MYSAITIANATHRIQDGHIEMDNQDNVQQTPTVDLGPLSWVISPLHDVFERVRSSLHQFGNEVATASAGGLSTLETTDLLLAAHSLHDAAGVLNLVERPATARMVSLMEQCVQHFVSDPALCTQQAVSILDQSISSISDFLDSMLKGHPANATGLFPAYRDLAQLAGLERIHPADLWMHPWSWLEIDSALLPAAQDAEQKGSDASFFENVLKVLKSNGTQGISTLTELVQHAWQQSSGQKERVFWQLATGYLQLLDADTLFFDNYNKRLLSGIAVQYDQLTRGKGQASEQLAQDMLFFIALGYSKQPDNAAAPVANAIAQTYVLQNTPICEYEQLLYGKVAPALREKMRKEIANFKELWSDISSGDIRKITILINEAEHLAESISTLWPKAQDFTNALLGAVRKVQMFARIPSEDVAIEVAMSVLFLESSLEDLQDSNTHFNDRAALLAQRLQSVQNGQQPTAHADWMDAFYNRLSSKDSTEQVIVESRAALAEVEQALDGFFRQPENQDQAQKAIGKLVEIASILTIIGFTEASQAASAMADQVQQLLATLAGTSSIEDPACQTYVQRLGSNLSALSFMFETIRYQPERAKQQFFFDIQQQQLRHQTDAPPKQVKPAISQNKPVLTTAAPSNDNIVDTPVDGDLREIFLEEAAEVISEAQITIQSLQSNMAYMPQLTNLRRAFHTLKGSGRMVGLASFGEAAWEIERVLNSWLADNKPATQPLLQFTSSALGALSKWRAAIAEQKNSLWHHRYFTQPAAAMLEQGVFVPVVNPDDDDPTPPGSSEPSISQQDSVASITHDETPLFHAPQEEQSFHFDDFSLSQATQILEEELLLDTDTSPALEEELLFAPEPAPTPNSSDAVDSQGMPAIYSLHDTESDTFSPSTLADLESSTSTTNTPQLLQPDDALLKSFTVKKEVAEAALFTDDTSPEDATLPFTSSDSNTVEEPPLFADEVTIEPTQETAPDNAHLHNDLMADTANSSTGLSLDNSELLFTTQDKPEHTADTQAPAPAPSPQNTIASLLIDTSVQMSILKDMVDGLPEDEIRRIGDLQIPLALFNAYLNEADTWSRQLVQDLGEWALEFTQSAPESLIRLAHSLVGSSATIGMSSLASVARGIEYALIHLENRTAKAADIHILLKAAERIRQELHQFAAGLSRPFDTDILNELAAVIDNTLPDEAQTSSAAITPPAEPDKKKT